MVTHAGPPRPAAPGEQGQSKAPRRVRKAVFPAAGLGTRMLPATKAQPKEMLNVVDKPLIQYGVEEAVAAGLSQVILVTAAHKSSMEDHFDLAPELERLLERKGDTKTLAEVRRVAQMAQICSVRQQQALGLGHAVLVAKDVVGDEPFAVFLPDDIIDSGDDEPCMRQLLRVHERLGCSVIAAERVPAEHVSRYGILAVREVEPRLYQVLDMVEKPRVGEAPSNLAIMGRYVLTPDIFPMLEQTSAGAGGEIQLTDGLKRLLEHQTIYAYEYVGRRYDCGNKLGYLRATVELALKRDDLKVDFRRILEENVQHLLTEERTAEPPHGDPLGDAALTK
jgi:UTP--glucose-1-phosphate uridylyltransferase